MTKLGKLQKARRSERRTWEAVLRYVNGADSPATQFPDFKAVVSAGLDWIGGDYDDIQICLDLQEEINSRGVELLASDQAEVRPAMEFLAARYRPEIREVLTWLSAPERRRELASRAAEFLRKHGTAIQMNINGNTGFNDSKEHSLVFEWPGDCGSVVSPVCKFILDQIERHDHGGENLRQAIPIGMCDWQGCSKFRLIQKARPGHCFCSTLCRAKYHQKSRSKKEKAAYMRQHRATLDRHKPQALKRRK